MSKKGGTRRKVELTIKLQELWLERLEKEARLRGMTPHGLASEVLEVWLVAQGPPPRNSRRR